MSSTARGAKPGGAKPAAVVKGGKKKKEDDAKDDEAVEVEKVPEPAAVSPYVRFSLPLPHLPSVLSSDPLLSIRFSRLPPHLHPPLHRIYCAKCGLCKPRRRSVRESLSCFT